MLFSFFFYSSKSDFIWPQLLHGFFNFKKINFFEPSREVPLGGLFFDFFVFCFFLFSFFLIFLLFFLSFFICCLMFFFFFDLINLFFFFFFLIFCASKKKKEKKNMKRNANKRDASVSVGPDTDRPKFSSLYS